MGTIVSPANGATVYKGAVVPIIYRSDTVDFNCAGLANICTVRYKLDGVDQAGFVGISQSGTAPQTQAAENITMPLTGSSAVVDVEAWGVGGQLNDTATVTLNLIDPPAPSATCTGATDIQSSQATLNGTLADLPAGGQARFWIDGVGGQIVTYANGAASATIAFAPSTTYTYHLEILDAPNGNVIAQSSDCSFTTLATATPTATCSVATGASQTSLTLNGTLANVPTGGSARFRYGTANGGPYPDQIAATPYANGAVTATVTGLTTGTVYYYVLEVLDATSTVVAVSAQCNGTTLSTPGAPVTVEAQLVKLCSITGVTLLRDCDTNEPILLVHVSSADGDVIPVTSTEFPAGAGAGVFSVMGYYRSYYAATDGAYLNPQPANICLPSSAGKIEILCACDDADGDGVGEVSYRKIVKVDDAGTVTLLATYNRTMTAVYTPVSPIDCSLSGDNLVAVEPHYKVLTGTQTWSVAADAALPVTSVTVMVIAAGNTPPTVTDAGGTYPLFAGQSVSWSSIYARDVAGLRSPLVFTCTAGSTLAIAWTEEVI